MPPHGLQDDINEFRRAVTSDLPWDGGCAGPDAGLLTRAAHGQGVNSSRVMALRRPYNVFGSNGRPSVSPLNGTSQVAYETSAGRYLRLAGRHMTGPQSRSYPPPLTLSGTSYEAHVLFQHEICDEMLPILNILCHNLIS